MVRLRLKSKKPVKFNESSRAGVTYWVIKEQLQARDGGPVCVHLGEGACFEGLSGWVLL